MARPLQIKQCQRLVYAGRLRDYEGPEEVWAHPETKGCQCSECMTALAIWFEIDKARRAPTSLDSKPLWDEVRQALKHQDLDSLAHQLNVSARELQRLKTNRKVTIGFIDRVCHGLGTHPAIIYGSLW